MNVTVTDGSVVIRWPPGRDGAILAWMTAIEDAETGKPITTCVRGIIRFAADDLVRADLELFCTADGEPITDGAPVLGDDGEPLTAVFRFRVARMEVQVPPSSPAVAVRCGQCGARAEILEDERPQLMATPCPECGEKDWQPAESSKVPA